MNVLPSSVTPTRREVLAASVMVATTAGLIDSMLYELAVRARPAP